MKKRFFLTFLCLSFSISFAFDDFLGIGLKPTPPSQESILVDGFDLDEKIRQRNKAIPQLRGSFGNSNTTISDPISLLHPNGGLLTVWALKEGNWLWGYTLYDSIPFGDARVWRIITHADGKVSFKNEYTGNCITAYANGVIHYRCDNANNEQKWELIFFKNQAVQIKNVAHGNCLQSPPRVFWYYSVFLTDCIKAGEKNFDQQWYIIPPAFRTKPLYVTNPN